MSGFVARVGLKAMLSSAFGPVAPVFSIIGGFFKAIWQWIVKNPTHMLLAAMAILACFTLYERHGWNKADEKLATANNNYKKLLGYYNTERASYKSVHDALLKQDAEVLRLGKQTKELLAQNQKNAAIAQVKIKAADAAARQIENEHATGCKTGTAVLENRDEL